MEWRIKVFGPLAQTRRRSEFTMNLAETVLTVAELRARLAAIEPDVAPLLPVCRFAVNHAFAGEEQQVTAQDEIALIGLVSGG